MRTPQGEHFVPERNTIHERACFHRRSQKEGETVDAFIRNLYELAEHCKFGTQRDEQIRDRIVISILDKLLSQKLQMKSDLTLDTAIQMARQSELVKVQVAGQSDFKHAFGRSISEEKERQIQRVGQAVMFVTKIPRTLRLFSLDLDVIAYTNKMKRAQREGRDVLNVEKLAILLLFAVL